MATFLVCVHGSDAPAAVLDVGGTGPYSSIQQAVDAAQPGDVLRIATGTYLGSVAVRKSLTILGGYDPAHTTRSLTLYPTWVLPRATSESVELARPGEAWLLTGAAVLIPRPGRLLIQGKTVRRIEAAAAAGEDWAITLDRDDEIATGPAWLVRPHDVVFSIANEPTSGSEPGNGAPLRVRLDGLVIVGGCADRTEGATADSGGAVHCHGGGETNFTLTRCELLYNSAVRAGGAVYVELDNTAKCQISSNTLTHNGCVGTSEPTGGALAIRLTRGCELLCSGNRIGDNRSLGRAGGLDVEADSGCYVRLADNTITTNTAQTSGGGLTARVTLLSLLESVGNRIEGNQAASGSCGGAYVELAGNSRGSLRDERIRGNLAEAACGGLGLSVASESRCDVTGGQISENGAGECGGLLMALESGAVLNLAGLDLMSNQATTGRNGAFGCAARDSAVLEMTTVTVVANRAAGDCGAGALVADGSSSITLSGCRFAFNMSKGKCGVGQIAGHHRSPIKLLGCRFASNLAGTDGGAVDLVVDTSSSLLMADCRFEGNEAERQNGFGSITAAGESPVTVEDCRFVRNRARGGANGVGLFDFREGSSVVFDGCSFTSNSAASDSGVGRWGLALESWAEFSDCVFRDNVTSGSGGVGFLHLADASAVAFRRCDVSRNEALEGPYGAFCVEAYFDCLLVFDETVFEDNASSGPFAALYAYCDGRTALSMASCEFRRNRAEAGSYGACAIEAQQDSPVSIRGTTVTENLSGGDHGGLYVAVAGRSPVMLVDCRLTRNVASAGDGGALTVVAENESTVSLAAIHCWANRAYGDGGGVAIRTRGGCPVIIEGCDWYDNIAWHEQTASVLLEDAGNDSWRIGVSPSPIRHPPSAISPEIGDLVTQGSQTWAVADARTEGGSTLIRLAGAGRPRSGKALLRHVLGDAGAFVIDQQDGGGCFLSRLQVTRNRSGRDYGAGQLKLSGAREVQVRDCTFADNTAGRMVGAASFQFEFIEEARLERNAFAGNRAGWREGVATGGHCGGFDFYGRNAHVLFSGNSLRANRALVCGSEGGNWGGGLFDVEEASVAELVQNEIRDNRADRDVGGLEIGCADLSVARAHDNVIIGNHAGEDFGGLAVGADSFSPVGIERNEIRANRAEDCGGGMGLRPNGSPEGYILMNNQFTSNTAAMGSAAFVMGSSTFQGNFITQNSAPDTRHSNGAVALVTTDASSFNDILTDNPGTAIVALGGDIHCSAIVGQVGNLSDSVVIEGTTSSLGSLLFCAPRLPVYLVQGTNVRRIREAEPGPTTATFRLRLESGDPLTSGRCEVATEVLRPVTLSRVEQGWRLEPQNPPPATGNSEPQASVSPGDRIIQGAIEHFVVGVEGEAPFYTVVFDDETSLTEGEAFLATPPLDPASLQMTNTVISGSRESVLPIGDALVEIKRGAR